MSRTTALTEFAASLIQLREFAAVQELAALIPYTESRATIFKELLDAQLQDKDTKLALEKTLAVAPKISQTDLQGGPYIAKEMAIRFVEAGLYQRALDTLGFQETEDFLLFFLDWRRSLEEYYPSAESLWQKVLLAVLEIICRERHDLSGLRDIFRGNGKQPER